ncbi:MAG: hypothetical protein M0R06_24405 [Sphaerochaeta sp.]|jgi:hypothetical protein|nr:hypothetical protein [Sphaerochaeta sp.]
MSAARPENWLHEAIVDLKHTHEVMPQQFLGSYYCFLDRLNDRMRQVETADVPIILDKLHGALDKVSV